MSCEAEAGEQISQNAFGWSLGGPGTMQPRQCSPKSLSSHFFTQGRFSISAILCYFWLLFAHLLSATNAHMNSREIQHHAKLEFRICPMIMVYERSSVETNRAETPWCIRVMSMEPYKESSWSSRASDRLLIWEASDIFATTNTSKSRTIGPGRRRLVQA